MATDKGRRAVERVAEDVAAGHQVYPPRVFRAMDETPSNGVRVVILGQDPYHGQDRPKGFPFRARRHQGSTVASQHQEGVAEGSGRARDSAGIASVLGASGGAPSECHSDGEGRRLQVTAPWAGEMLTDSIIQAVSETAPHAVFML